jgi:hypothetical protein
VVELEDGGDDGDAGPEGMQKREALEGWKVARLKGWGSGVVLTGSRQGLDSAVQGAGLGSEGKSAEEERADADADGGAEEPGEEDAKDDERQHRGEILAGLRVG